MNKKSIFAIFLALVLVFGMAACSKDEGEGGESGSPENDVPFFSRGLDDNGFYEGVTAKDYVTLGQYEGIEIPADALIVTEEDIDYEVEGIVENYTDLKEVTDRAAQLGDTVDIDYAGYMDGEQFDGGTGNNPALELGSNAFIDGFEDGIVGHSTGDSFSLELNFPDPYYNNEALSGKPVTFEVTLNSISEPVVPELTDAFVANTLQETYGWTSIADMRADIEDTLRENAKLNYIYDALEEFEVSEVPDTVFDCLKNNMISYYEQMAAMYGMTLDDFISGMGVGSIDDVVEMSREQLLASGRSALINQAIAEDANIRVDDADIEAEFADMTEEEYQDIVDYYGLPYIKSVLLDEKIVQHCIDSAVIQ